MAEWFLYIIRTGQGHLYTGITTDVARRFSEHQHGKIGAKYLRSQGPLTLVYQRPIGERSLAAKVEYAIKKLSKSRKESLVAQQLNRHALLAILNLNNDPHQI